MAKKVLILNNEVVDVADTAFEVHSSLTWMDCSDDSVNTRWTLVDGVLTAPSNEITSQDWAKFRDSRNRKLQQSDWTQSRDVSLSNDNNTQKIKNNNKIEVLSISSLMAEAIKRISNSTSVSDLFN